MGVKSFAIVVLAVVVLWITYSQLAELGKSNDGCCKTKTCGKSGTEKFVRNINLVAAVAGTLIILWDAYSLYSGGASMGDMTKSARMSLANAR